MDGNGDIADGIFAEEASYEAALPPAGKSFLPWHRPRKQFVRTRQWQGELKSLLNDHPLPEGQALRYLGLPGADLLDLRQFHEDICEPTGIPLRFLGFNSGATPGSASYNEMELSLDEVRRLQFVDEQSQMLTDDFVLLANEKSFAFVKAKQAGPFDVVNLDLCDGFGTHAPGGANNTYYAAIARLLTLQSRQSRPWLLYLTTRSDSPTVNADVMQTIVGIYRDNLEQNADFREKSLELFQLDAGSLDAALATPTGHMRVFATGLSKWFIHMALEGQPPVRVHVRSAMGYKVVRGAEEVDMISLAFRFEPSDAPFPDRAGLAGQPQEAPAEGPLALKALNKVARMKDVDALLGDQPDLLAELVSSMAHLVGLARYDPDAYRAWADEDVRMEA